MSTPLDNAGQAGSICESLIVAMSSNGCIGLDNALPWRLRDDLQHFKNVTMGAAVIMGRKTWDSIGRPLPGRLNIVLSRNANAQYENCLLVADLDQARQEARKWCSEKRLQEYFIIGGATIYQQSLEQAERMYLTLVHTELDGDAWFELPDLSGWRELKRTEYKKNSHNDWDFSILQLERKKRPFT